MRPTGAPAAVVARDEGRFDARLFRRRWFGGTTWLSTSDAEVLAAEHGKQF